MLSESSYTDTPVYPSHPEEILNLQLELDILKIILAEKNTFRREVDERANHASDEDNCPDGRVSCKSDKYEDTKDELKNAKALIEALESEQFQLITETEEIREKCNQQSELLKKKEHEISLLSNRIGICSCKVDKLALVKQEEEVRRQVEIETSEVIVCLQDELVTLHEELVAFREQAEDSKKDESITKQRLVQLETESEELQSILCLVTQENERLKVLVKEKDSDLRSLTEDWERLAYEIADILADGHVSLEEASDQVVSISDSIQPRSRIGEQVERMIGGLAERDLHIEELHKCLEEAQNIRYDMEWKLRSLRGAALAISEAQQQESCDKEREIFRLTSEITNMVSTINGLECQIKVNEEQIKKAELCATVAFKIVNKLSELNATHLQEIEHVKFLLDESKHAEAQTEIQALSSQLKQSQLHIAELQKLSQDQVKARDSEETKKEEGAVLPVMAQDF